MILEENIMKKWILLFAAAVALLGFSGCKAKQKEKTVTVLEITSDQKETEICICILVVQIQLTEHGQKN